MNLRWIIVWIIGWILSVGGPVQATSVWPQGVVDAADPLGFFYDIPPDEEVLREDGPAVAQLLEKSASLKIFVWNVYKGQRDRLLPDLQVYSEASDFVLLQETLTSTSFTNAFNRVNGMAWHSAISFFDEKVGTGVSTGSRFAISSLKFLRSEPREPIINTPKMVLLAEYPIEGEREPLLVANIHGINFVANSDFKKQIRQLFNELAQHRGPILLGGDFNTWNADRRKFLVKMTQSQDLVHVTWPRDHRFFELDHIFVRGLDVKRSHILDYVDSSDHEPLFIEAKLH
ncbi:MAG: endonuclease/exonuclease/phosphatase family protein [Pseudobdellovibrionaceae bacterium]|nr:endonuclease/exonuclease/phosphatase family protein [Bdellovibrionales bacterium]USN48550.1 MAG: endonuclease/exonuclease/phosphatase family protein [Pseudobdellovibrionaceae bacterium]